ncbi:suppressor of los1-1 [Ophidiomyces ophidiicola]|nr:suppressor of los1-1 [Ophidiomyces ophidiicola]KAI1934398.1 suppressor of los1-1 [Ophidiomyces ophidiicola]
MPGAGPRLFSFDDLQDLTLALRKYVVQSQNNAIARHDTFRVAISGGSLPVLLAKAFIDIPSSPEDEHDLLRLSKWDIFLADERVVPLDHEDSNYRLVMAEFVNKLSAEFGEPKIHPISLDHTKENEPQEVADLYQEELMHSFAAKDSVKLPVFDLLLLGCGPDGHTCSLFPQHELLNSTISWVDAISNSPKPPPKRITLTMPVLTHGLRIAFVATGEGKRDILKKIFDTADGKLLPCGLVNEKGAEKVTWFTDSKATEGVAFPKGSL